MDVMDVMDAVDAEFANSGTGFDVGKFRRRFRFACLLTYKLRVP